MLELSFLAPQDTLLCPPPDFVGDQVTGPLSVWLGPGPFPLPVKGANEGGLVPRGLASLCPKAGFFLYFMTSLGPQSLCGHEATAADPKTKVWGGCSAETCIRKCEYTHACQNWCL